MLPAAAARRSLPPLPVCTVLFSYMEQRQEQKQHSSFMVSLLDALVFSAGGLHSNQLLTCIITPACLLRSKRLCALRERGTPRPKAREAAKTLGFIQLLAKPDHQVLSPSCILLFCRNVAHRDLKLENLLLASPDNISDIKVPPCFAYHASFSGFLPYHRHTCRCIIASHSPARLLLPLRR